MSQSWDALMRRKNARLADDVRLVKLQVDRSGEHMRAMMEADRILNNREWDELYAFLREHFPGFQYEVRVSTPSLAQSVVEDISAWKGYLTDRLARLHPGAKPFLKGGAWSLSGDQLTVTIHGDMAAEYLSAQGVPQAMSDLMRDQFHLDMKVSVVSDGDENARLQRIARERELSDKRVAEAAQKALENAQKGKNAPSPVILGKVISRPVMEMKDLKEDSGQVALEGEILKMESKSVKNDTKLLVTCVMTDYTNTVNCKAFLAPKNEEEKKTILDGLAVGQFVRIEGRYLFDNFIHDMSVMMDNVNRAKKPVREDTAPVKRVELHLHTQMSTMDAVSSPTDLIKQAAKWGHPAIAITDHGVLQAFPEAFGAAKKNDIKLIPGCEGYLIDDSAQIVDMADDRPLDGITYVALDVETTGLNTATDEIIEIGAVRVENGVEVGEFSQLIRPSRPIPPKVVELTGIDDGMVRSAPPIQDVIGSFAEFCQGAVLVAHNASFDMAFFERAFNEAGLPFDHPKADTLTFARNLYRDQKSHKLGALCKYLGIELVKAHRATHDARACGKLFETECERLRKEKHLTRLNELNSAFDGDAGGKSYHIVLLAATQKGMENLNHIVSDAHLKYFYRTPRIPRKLITQCREGLIVGSACEAGELFRAMVAGKDEKTLERIARFYDYLEIQPIGNNAFMIREGIAKDEEELREYNRRIVRLGEKLNIPVVATGDVHFKEPKDAIFRAIIMAAKGFEDADFQPPLYFRTTDDMLNEFAYLGEEKAYEVVVENPRAIAEKVGKLRIFVEHPEGKETFQPFWENAEAEIRQLSENRAREIYGDPIPGIVRSRMDKELGSICGYGFSTLYDIAVKLVTKSTSDGYIVGSRGSVGSSFIAFLTGITEVNSLPPHYVCPKCKHAIWDPPAQYACGLDLPPMACPKCGEDMGRYGFNIPFEVFLGFKGDKVPDIDLNFSGEYQSTAHNYVKELFGAENVFRAGTIGTVAEKTAYGYVLKYLEERGLTASQAEKDRLALGCTGVKRTTGQHPAGMVVLPKGYSIYQFTAIQHPADDMTTDTVTTHFDFNSMHDVLVKLDILGHDDPTMLRDLQDITGIPPVKVPLEDPEVFKNILSLFRGPQALGVTAEEIECKTGTLGVPEFGTSFVRGMLMDTLPSTFDELVRISGLSHGTDVWLGNIQDIIKSGAADLKHAICTRDDIMNQLMAMGVEPKMAFDIMEFVRKGKAAKGGGLKPEMLQAMQEHNVPDWFIGACNKIGYMFPKAHAVAYVMMALRIAYFKIYYPTAYYACFLKRNIEKFDASTMVAPVDALKDRLHELMDLPKPEQDKEGDKITILESLIEMGMRGVEILPVDVYKSEPTKFVLEGDKQIRAPFCSLPGLGLSAALPIVQARENGAFTSREDMVRRKISKSVVEMLRSVGALGDMPETSQMTFFDDLGL